MQGNVLSQIYLDFHTLQPGNIGFHILGRINFGRKVPNFY